MSINDRNRAAPPLRPAVACGAPPSADDSRRPNGIVGQHFAKSSTVEQVKIVPVEADWRAPLARFGLLAKAALFGALGVLAIQVARGDRSADTVSTQGAIQLVATQPVGRWLLVILTVGLFALAIWQALLVATGDPVQGSKISDRVTYAVKAVLYFGTGWTSLMVLMGDWGAAGSTGGTDSPQQAAATAMVLPGGPWLVGLAGAAIIALGVYQAHAHAWHRAFMRRMDRARMSRRVDRWVERAGRWGYGARASVLVTTGIFLVVAAMQHDPREAVGVGGALDRVAAQPWGDAGLWFVAIGFVAYGIFCIAEARYRRAV
jgi:hypothetical protein